MKSYVAPRKPKLNAQQRRLRAAWCQYHLDWTEQDWSQIIFSDESNFELVNRKNRLYVRRYRYDQKRFERSQPRIHKGGGLGVWPCMTNYGLGDLQDNARHRVSRKTQEYMKKRHITTLQWPSNSPDLNLIENLWSIMDKQLLKYSLKNIDDLKAALNTTWNAQADRHIDFSRFLNKSSNF
ncbi:unnamed protein product [Rotaria sp. Silwood1]|nr:unnamed protein product [Rotaria sp. Silwood1]